jgi:hypothetical protein
MTVMMFMTLTGQSLGGLTMRGASFSVSNPSQEQVLTPHDLMRTLSKISKEIEAQATEITRCDVAAVKARVALKKRYAGEFLACAGSMDIRRYTSELETCDLLLASEIADQELRAASGALRVLRDRLEVGRSFGPLIRLEWGQS